MTDQLPATLPDKPRRITHKIRAAIDAMVSGDAKNITVAAEKAGLSRSHLSRAARKAAAALLALFPNLRVEIYNASTKVRTPVR